MDSHRRDSELLPPSTDRPSTPEPKSAEQSLDEGDMGAVAGAGSAAGEADVFRVEAPSTASSVRGSEADHEALREALEQVQEEEDEGSEEGHEQRTQADEEAQQQQQQMHQENGSKGAEGDGGLPSQQELPDAALDDNKGQVSDAGDDGGSGVNGSMKSCGKPAEEPVLNGSAATSAGSHSKRKVTSSASLPAVKSGAGGAAAVNGKNGGGRMNGSLNYGRKATSPPDSAGKSGRNGSASIHKDSSVSVH